MAKRYSSPLACPMFIAMLTTTEGKRFSPEQKPAVNAARAA
jgi:hypothetical protein